MWPPRPAIRLPQPVVWAVTSAIRPLYPGCQRPASRPHRPRLPASRAGPPPGPPWPAAPVSRTGPRPGPASRVRRPLARFPGRSGRLALARPPRTQRRRHAAV